MDRMCVCVWGGGGGGGGLIGKTTQTTMTVAVRDLTVYALMHNYHTAVTSLTPFGMNIALWGTHIKFKVNTAQ